MTDAEDTTPETRPKHHVVEPPGRPRWPWAVGGVVAGALLAGGVAWGMAASGADDAAPTTTTTITVTTTTTSTTIPSADVGAVAARLDRLCGQISGLDDVVSGVRAPREVKSALDTIANDLATVQDGLEHVATGNTDVRTTQLQDFADSLQRTYDDLDQAVNEALQGNFGNAQDSFQTVQTDLDETWAMAQDLGFDQCAPGGS